MTGNKPVGQIFKKFDFLGGDRFISKTLFFEKFSKWYRPVFSNIFYNKNYSIYNNYKNLKFFEKGATGLFQHQKISKIFPEGGDRFIHRPVYFPSYGNFFFYRQDIIFFFFII